MPLTYLDSSAVVKRYVPEAGSSWVARLCEQEPIAISLITIPEIASALARRTREGELSVQQRDGLLRSFLRDVSSFIVIDMSQTVVLRATSLLMTAPASVRLRTLDALHLASAQMAFSRASRGGVETGAFVTADRALLNAAAWAGLTALDPNDRERERGVTER